MGRKRTHRARRNSIPVRQRASPGVRLAAVAAVAGLAALLGFSGRGTLRAAPVPRLRVEASPPAPGRTTWLQGEPLRVELALSYAAAAACHPL